MPSPVKPSEFKAVIVEPDDGVGTALKKTFLQFPVLFWRWFRYKYEWDGSFTIAYREDVCNACASTSAGVSTPTNVI